MTGAIIAVIVILAIIFISGIKIVPQAQVYVVERLGTFKGALHTGPHYVIPIFDKVVKKVSIKEQVVTEAVLAKVREVCEAYLDPKKLQPIAADAVEKARKAENHEAEIQSIQGKIDSLTANLDKMYMDRLPGLLAEADFERIYQRVKMDRTSLEEKLKELEAQIESPVNTEDRAKVLVQQFLDSAYTSRELLVSLIERVELTEDKQIIIKFRFRELEAIS